MEEIKLLFLGWAAIGLFSAGWVIGAFWCFYNFCDCDCEKSGDSHE